MNDINFIKPIAHQEQQAIATWFRRSKLLFLLTVVGVTVIQLNQQRKITQAKQEALLYASATATHDLVVKKHALLKQQEEQLTKQHNKMNQLLHNPKNPIAYLTAIQQALGKEMSLENIHISGTTIELTAKCPDTAHATKLVEALNKTAHFKQVAMTALNTHTNQGKKIMVIKLKGSLIKENNKVQEKTLIT